MLIKKDKNSNDYLLTRHGNTWVRNFTKDAIREVDINNLVDPKDHRLFIENTAKNDTYSMPHIDIESLFCPKVAIVSDGYGFDKCQEMLGSLPEDTTILATNGALAKWRLFGTNPVKRNINYYIINNPYQEATLLLPKKHRYFPKCIASVRTNSKFLKLYHGNKFRYTPVPQENFGFTKTDARWLIDDYRNPVAAAISLAYKMEAYKVLVFCCDYAYEGSREGAVQLKSGLWQYPAQQHATSIIDSQLHWLASNEDRLVQTAVYAPEKVDYEYCTYIAREEVVNFFKDD